MLMKLNKNNTNVHINSTPIPNVYKITTETDFQNQRSSHYSHTSATLKHFVLHRIDQDKLYVLYTLHTYKYIYIPIYTHMDVYL